MGYSNYYYCAESYDKSLFSKVVNDFKKIIPSLNELGIYLGDAFGRHQAIINNDRITFNGRGEQANETFELVREMRKIPEWKKRPDSQVNGLIFESTKTSHKRYDLAVQICLIIAKEHFKDQIMVNSDGDILNWTEAKKLCQSILGYGFNFKLDVY